eukprot:6181984-Pleurochrysis_carterae.AAC.4
MSSRSFYLVTKATRVYECFLKCKDAVRSCLKCRAAVTHRRAVLCKELAHFAKAFRRGSVSRRERAVRSNGPKTSGDRPCSPTARRLADKPRQLRAEERENLRGFPAAGTGGICAAVRCCNPVVRAEAVLTHRPDRLKRLHARCAKEIATHDEAKPMADIFPRTESSDTLGHEALGALK